MASDVASHIRKSTVLWLILALTNVSTFVYNKNEYWDDFFLHVYYYIGNSTDYMVTGENRFNVRPLHDLTSQLTLKRFTLI